MSTATVSQDSLSSISVYLIKDIPIGGQYAPERAVSIGQNL
jgi:hypothetical protein